MDLRRMCSASRPGTSNKAMAAATDALYMCIDEQIHLDESAGKYLHKHTHIVHMLLPIQWLLCRMSRFKIDSEGQKNK
jgi:hypothetical protein